MNSTHMLPRASEPCLRLDMEYVLQKPWNSHSKLLGANKNVLVPYDLCKQGKAIYNIRATVLASVLYFVCLISFHFSPSTTLD